MTGLKEVVGEELSLGYPLFQKLHNNNHPRPLIPKPYLSSTNHNYINNNNNSPSSYLNRLPQHHHNFGTNKGDEGNNNNNNNNNKDNNVSMTHNQVMVSSRWNPTPEQLSALEELYRCGTRTPSAEQIQHITAQLGRYGKIEGKNVFYWFQNHKARERQKRRRLLTSTTTIHANHSTDNTQEGFQNEEKSCKRTSLIKSKEYDPPIDSNLGPRKADKISSSNNNSSTNNNECLHFHENCAQFQHNYNILSPKHTHFMTSSQNQTNVNYNNINNINISNINNININNTNTTNNNDNNNININLQPCLSSFHDLKNVTTKTTTSVTLQLFPVSEEEEEEEEEEEDDDDDVVDELKAKKDRQDILSSFGKNDNENVMSCMDSNYFVPYYQFL